MNLFGRVRGWFRKSEPEYADSQEYYGDVLAEETLEPAAEPMAADSLPSDAFPAEMPDYAAEIAPPPDEPQEAASVKPGTRQIQVPLAPIVAALPDTLRGRLLVDNVGEASIFLSLENILPQLARGVACITFGELREAASGVFNSKSDLDAEQVSLPLSLILPRITPDVLARKQRRAQMDIPDEIVSPFADMGRGLVIANVPRGSVATASNTAPGPVAAPIPEQPAPITPATPNPSAQPRPSATPTANLGALRTATRPASTLATA